MRTSHKRIRELIKDEKTKLTDEQIFSSNSFAAYLTDIAEATSERFKKKLSVKTEWNESENAYVAYTDNTHIRINCGNKITADYPTRELKHLSLLGLLGHEEGHVLYTNFQILGLFMQAVDNGTMYPKIPVDFEDEDQENLKKYLELLKEKDEKANCIVKYVLHSTANILEDVFVEDRVCADFPGTFKTGIRLNNIKLTESSLSISEQVEKKVPKAAIILNAILQYARIGEFNNAGGYKGDIIDSFVECIEYIDDAVYKTDARERYDNANKILIKMWPYVEEWIEEIKKNPSLTPQEVKEMLDKLSKELGEASGSTGGSELPSGTTTGLRGTYKPDFSKRSKESKEIKEFQDVLESEGDRIELTKTTDIDDSGTGGVEKNNSYAGSGYRKAADDIERLLSGVAEERAEVRYNQELSDELQKEANNIRYGNAHKGVKVNVNRIAEIPDYYRQDYKRIAPPLLAISKRMQKQIMQKLKDDNEGGRINGLMMGKRMNARSFASDDGRLFYNKKYPTDEAKMAVAILNDESGSMRSNDRITSARAASLVLYDFCTSLGIPVAVYGHTEYCDVELFSYAEFDRVDKNDRFRIMDMIARSGNRDGAALRYVAERLMTRDEKKRILIIISDGQPAGNGYGGTAAEADLRGIKQEYKNKGIITFAAAIGSDKHVIERIYKDGYLDITDLNKLPMMLTKLLLKFLKR